MGLNFKTAVEKTTKTDYIFSIKYSDFIMDSAKFLKKGHPFIITEAFNHYDTEDDFLKRFIDELGENMISIRTNDYKNPAIYSTLRVTENQTINSYLKNVFSKEIINTYAANNLISKDSLNALNLFYPLKEITEVFESPRVWIGPKGSLTPLHRDSSDNFSYQLIGKKKWTIFSIVDDEKLYFSKNKFGSLSNVESEFSTSPIDLRNVDKRKFPLYKDATPIEVIINPFEIFYLPYGWGHSAENLSTTIMINFWFTLKNYLPYILR